MSVLAREAEDLRHWLFEAALPLWWQVGADRAGGGFHEAIDLDGTPVARPHRARVVARQAFSYCEAGRLGWDGPWREAAAHALDYLGRHFAGTDGTVASLVGLDGRISEPGFDLYNQAFALLGYASGHRVFGEAAGWRQRAVALRTTLNGSFAHPRGGFREDREGRLPLRSNPHMHLLESALAWMTVDDDPAWRGMADGIAKLCLDTFIDPASGALREFFAADWSPAAGTEGRIAEPGHHYEWVFLLDRWAKLTGRERPQAIARLLVFADTHGCDTRRGVAVSAVLTDGSPYDPVARLWAQAERIRAYTIDHRAGDEERLTAAIKGLRRFLATPTPGLWFDRLGADDRFILEPARATSLYHIVGAVIELANALRIGSDSSAAIRSHERPQRLIYLVTEDWYFISHRLPMARAARDAGFEVHVATRVDRHGEAIAAEGFHLHPVPWRRGSLDPRDLVETLRAIRKVYRDLKPDLAHHVALQAAVTGSLAAIGLPVMRLNALTGLGTIFVSDKPKARAVRPALRVLLRSLFKRPGSSVLVQNRDDRATVERLGIEPSRIALIPGSGVDVAAMSPSPEPQGPVTIAFAGRIVEDKGIRALVEAHRLLRGRGREIRLLIAGSPDPANPGSIPEQDIAAWTRLPGLTYLGYVADIAAFWASAHIAVLPSRREGLPLSLLEAAACGRALVATDVPGCREIARAGVNALLVPPDDAQALAGAIERLASDAALRRQFGQASRALAEAEFSSERIGRDVVNLYRSLLRHPAG